MGMTGTMKGYGTAARFRAEAVSHRMKDRVLEKRLDRTAHEAERLRLENQLLRDEVEDSRTEHHRILDNAGSDPTVVVVVHVRPAHADRGHLDLHLTRPGLRHRPVLDPDVSRSVEHGAWVRHDYLRMFVVRD